MRKRTMAALILALFFIVVSLLPIYAMMREYSIGSELMKRYEIEHAYVKDGFPSILDENIVQANGHTIEIVEQDTGRDAPATWWDRQENVPGGDIVKVQLKLNGANIAEPVEMWLSNRERGSRYFSWLDVLTVRDTVSQRESVAIVQRLTDDDARMQDRRWRIVTIDEQGAWKEKVLTYERRSENPLGVRLVTVSGTSLMGMGYRSDLLHVYPSLVFPVMYPGGTLVLGLLLLFVGGALGFADYRNRGKRRELR